MKLVVAAAFALVVAAPASTFAQGVPPGAPGSPDEIMKMLDANKDGVITKDEAAQMPADAFAILDANKDGVITAEEVKNAPTPKGPPQ